MRALGWTLFQLYDSIYVIVVAFKAFYWDDSGARTDIALIHYTILYFTLLYFTSVYLTLFYFDLFWFILFYSILFYFILFYFILIYFILFYFILFYFILFYFILFYFILFYFILLTPHNRFFSPYVLSCSFKPNILFVPSLSLCCSLPLIDMVSWRPHACCLLKWRLLEFLQIRCGGIRYVRYRIV